MSENYKGKVHCVAPFSSAVIMQNKYVLPCCEWDTTGIERDVNKSLLDHFNQFVEFRKKFIDAKCNVNAVNSCKTCAIASYQYRMHNSTVNNNIDYVKNPTLTNLHLKFNNFCNLACRMCDPDSSSILAKESNTNFNSTKNPFLKNVLPRDSKLYKSIFEILPNLEKLWFSGGEPFIQDQVWEIVEYCYENGYSKNIDLKFNTNGTVILNEKQIQMLKSFRQLNIDISMDGIESLAEYIRTKTVWSKWLHNFEKYLQVFEYAEINVACALSVYNVHKVDEIWRFFKRYNVGMSFTPVWTNELCVANLNKNAKKYLIEKYKNDPHLDRYPEVFNLLKTKSKNTNMKEYINMLDSRAKTSGMYKNYKSYSEIEKEWFDML